MKESRRKNIMNTDLSIIGSDLFDIYAEHNGVHCVRSTLPENQGTSSEYWFTIKMLCEIFEVSDKTLRNNIQLLIDDGEFVDCKKLQTTIIVKDSLDRDHKVVLYNLEVLNKLGMCCFRGNKKAREIRNKFNDVLVKEETAQNTLPALNKEDRLILLTVKSSSAEDRMIALGSLKELWTEEANKKLETADKRAYSAMGTASAKSKENTKLRAENEDLKVRLQESTNYICVKAIPWLNKYFIIPKEKENDSVYAQIGRKMTALSKKLNYEVKDIPDPRYEKGVHSYHVDVVEAFRKQLDNDSSILGKYRK